jgi:hypothetical protein
MKKTTSKKSKRSRKRGVVVKNKETGMQKESSSTAMASWPTETILGHPPRCSYRRKTKSCLTVGALLVRALACNFVATNPGEWQQSQLAQV